MTIQTEAETEMNPNSSLSRPPLSKYDEYRCWGCLILMLIATLLIICNWSNKDMVLLIIGGLPIYVGYTMSFNSESVAKIWNHLIFGISTLNFIIALAYIYH